MSEIFGLSSGDIEYGCTADFASTLREHYGLVDLDGAEITAPDEPESVLSDSDLFVGPAEHGVTAGSTFFAELSETLRAQGVPFAAGYAAAVALRNC